MDLQAASPARLAALLLALTACGGRVVVDEPSGADAGIPCVDTCAETLSEGGAVCASEGLAADFYQMLSNCACTGPGWSCGDVCGETYCVGRPPSPECDECLDGTCIKQWLGCTNT